MASNRALTPPSSPAALSGWRAAGRKPVPRPGLPCRPAGQPVDRADLTPAPTSTAAGGPATLALPVLSGAAAKLVHVVHYSHHRTDIRPRSVVHCQKDDATIE